MKTKHPVTQRFNEFVEYLKRNGKFRTYDEFAEMISVSNGQLGDIRNRPATNITLEIVVKTLETFDILNIEWLVLGKGEMLKGKTPSVGYGAIREAASYGYRALGDREDPEVRQLKEEIEKLRKDNTTLMDALRLAMGGKESSKTA